MLTSRRSRAATPRRRRGRKPTSSARAVRLLERTDAATRPVRLLGVSVHNFCGDAATADRGRPAAVPGRLSRCPTRYLESDPVRPLPARARAAVLRPDGARPRLPATCASSISAAAPASRRACSTSTCTRARRSASTARPGCSSRWARRGLPKGLRFTLGTIEAFAGARASTTSSSRTRRSTGSRITSG